MLGPLARISNKLGRNVMTNMARKYHGHGGIPGEVRYPQKYAINNVTIDTIGDGLDYSKLKNLPFDISNRYKLTAYYILFFGSGLAAPFLIVRHQLLKN